MDNTVRGVAVPEVYAAGYPGRTCQDLADIFCKILDSAQLVCPLCVIVTGLSVFGLSVRQGIPR